MSIAEIFLMVWAFLATVLAVMYRESAKKFLNAQKMTSILVAELATGEIKATQDADGMWTVENEGMKMQFLARRK